MTAMIGRSTSGASFIQNRPRKCTPCLMNPKIVTKKNTPKPRIAVTATCDVGAKAEGIKHVGKQHEEEKRHHQREVFRPVMPRDILNHIVNEIIGYFAN